MATSMVTGGTSGIGREFVTQLAARGDDIVIVARDTERMAAIKADVEARYGVSVETIAADLSRREDVDQITTRVEDPNHPVDLLVNNAGRPLLKQAIDVTWDEWDGVVDVNLKAAYFLACRLARHCIDAGRPGAIVNIASTHGLIGLGGRSVYGISKGGMMQMDRMLAIEWAELGIRINSVAPSTVLTASRREMYKTPEVIESMRQRIPTKRFIEPGEVAAAVCYLASPDAASITGQTLVVDGGITVA